MKGREKRRGKRVWGKSYIVIEEVFGSLSLLRRVIVSGGWEFLFCEFVFLFLV